MLCQKKKDSKSVVEFGKQSIENLVEAYLSGRDKSMIRRSLKNYIISNLSFKFIVLDFTSYILTATV